MIEESCDKMDLDSFAVVDISRPLNTHLGGFYDALVKIPSDAFFYFFIIIIYNDNYYFFR